ncbi:MAG: helix-turn-helix domain-containing protein [Pseudomonadota bacterium]
MPGDEGNKRLLLSATEAAQALGVSRTTVWRLVRSGSLPQPVKVRGAVRFRLFDIEAFVESLSSDVQEGTSGL